MKEIFTQVKTSILPLLLILIWFDPNIVVVIINLNDLIFPMG